MIHRGNEFADPWLQGWSWGDGTPSRANHSRPLESFGAIQAGALWSMGEQGINLQRRGQYKNNVWEGYNQNQPHVNMWNLLLSILP